MATLRTIIRLWALSVFIMDSTAQETTAFVGEDVLLMCNCSETTKQVVWQAGKDVVSCSDKSQDCKISTSYLNRTRLFFHKGNGNCSLLLMRVSPSDEKSYTCYAFIDSLSLVEEAIHLKVKANKASPTVTVSQQPTHHGTVSTDYTVVPPAKIFSPEVSVGVPITLIIVLVAGLLMAFQCRRHRQRTQTVVVKLEQASAEPMMGPSRV